MGYLFLVSLGPVQDFIASARRTRDLWFGSQLLSELSKAAALAIAEYVEASLRAAADPDAERQALKCLIFPALDEVSETKDLKLRLRPMTANKDPLNVANKIVAVIDGDARALGDQVRTAVKQRLQTIRDDTFKGI